MSLASDAIAKGNSGGKDKGSQYEGNIFFISVKC